MMNNTKTPIRHYSAMLYALADEIRSEEGCVTQSAEAVSSAAERLDTQKVTIDALCSVLRRTRSVIDEDREATWCCHVNTNTGKIDDQLGLNAIANYDEILRQIDQALEAAS